MKGSCEGNRQLVPIDSIRSHKRGERWMGKRPAALKIRNQIRSVNRRLAKDNAEPRNADRSLWSELAVVSFAGVTGLSEDLQIDPETVLCDLLADLMHWCDVQKTNHSEVESIDFE